jgi:hypothetical protein
MYLTKDWYPGYGKRCDNMKNKEKKLESKYVCRHGQQAHEKVLNHMHH